ncbi:hypothetical protein K04M5_49410 (plasmid) [Vibrio alginolyticus]|nr:hypothetical protein K04M5_49410 [Vibrio alginolyticus]
MAKTHLKVPGVDARDSGQTQFEFTHQTACGFKGASHKQK